MAIDNTFVVYTNFCCDCTLDFQAPHFKTNCSKAVPVHRCHIKAKKLSFTRIGAQLKAISQMWQILYTSFMALDRQGKLIIIIITPVARSFSN